MRSSPEASLEGLTCRVFEPGDPFLNGRVGREQREQAAVLSGDFQRLEGLRLVRFGSGNLRIMQTPERPQGVNHVFATGQARPAGVGPELALTRKPAYHQRAEQREDDLKQIHE